MHLGNEQINSHLQCSKEKSRNEKKYSAFSATSDVCHAMKGESNWTGDQLWQNRMYKSSANLVFFKRQNWNIIASALQHFSRQQVHLINILFFSLKMFIGGPQTRTHLVRTKKTNKSHRQLYIFLSSSSRSKKRWMGRANAWVFFCRFWLFNFLYKNRSKSTRTFLWRALDLWMDQSPHLNNWKCYRIEIVTTQNSSNNSKNKNVSSMLL